MDRNPVKNVINGVNLVKICHFYENVQNWVILGAKMTSYVKILGKWSKKFFTAKFEKLFQGVYMDAFY